MQGGQLVGGGGEASLRVPTLAGLRVSLLACQQQFGLQALALVLYQQSRQGCANEESDNEKKDLHIFTISKKTHCVNKLLTPPAAGGGCGDV